MSKQDPQPVAVEAPEGFSFSDDELASFLDGRQEEDSSPVVELAPVEPSGELLAVSRRIAGQFVDLIQAFSASVFTRRLTPATTSQFSHAVDALHRLAVAAGDEQQARLLEEMQGLLHNLEHHGDRSRDVDRISIRLRACIPAFSASLESVDAERLVNMVSYKNQHVPLLAELGNIPGIGKRRLERLYISGLYTVEAVCAAEPSELAAVTGLPLTLATRVVEATREYAIQQQRRCVMEMRERARELVRAMGASPSGDPELVRLAMSTMAELQSVLTSLSSQDVQ